jgi:ATP adenylyltransferase
MNYLYAPWRSLYAKSIDNNGPKSTQPEQCDFCTKLAQNEDEKNLILRRFSDVFVCLNLYPYNAGHLLILPLQHQEKLTDLSLPARTQLMELVSASTQILSDVLKCQGINVGANLGKVSGASVPGHLHLHVLPRWQGDTNFMPTIAQTKQISFDLHDIYRQLKPAFDELAIQD